MIKLENISFSYDRTSLIADLSCEINRGEFVGIIGPNGSGKTTLIKLVCGLLKAGSGNVYLDGKNISDYSYRKRARLISVVPQEANIPFSFSVKEVVLMGRASYMSALSFEDRSDLAICERVMEMTKISHLSNRSIHEISGGERQRVVLARALAQEAEIIILDEPTNFLDLKHQVSIYQLLTRLNIEAKKTIIAVQHDINLAAIYCKRILILKDGGLISDGTPNDTITYANIKRAFDAETYVGVNEFTGIPYYIPYK
ncbi:MAG: ABC transporter ATP-binding protein [Pseudomonadota bacterium]